MTITNVTPTPAVQSTVTCPDCWGNGEFVTGSYSRTCGECHGEGVRVVTAKCDACGDSYPAGSGALFRFWSGKADDLLCPGCTAEALTDPENYTRVGDEPTPPAPTLPPCDACGSAGVAQAHGYTVCDACLDAARRLALAPDTSPSTRRLAVAISGLVIEHRKATRPAVATMRYVGKYVRDAHTGELMIWRTGAAGEAPGYYPLADRDPMPGTPAELAAMQADYAAMGVTA